MIRNIVVVLIVLAVGAGGVLVWLERTPPPARAVSPAAGASGQGQAKKAATKGASVSIAGGEVEQRDKKGNLVWKLKISGQFSTDASLGSLTGKKVVWDLTEAGGKGWRVTAPEIKVDYNGRRVVFPQGAEVRATDGSMSFVAKRVEYQMDTKKLVCEGGVKMTHPGGVVVADRMVIDTASRQVTAEGVRGSYSR